MCERFWAVVFFCPQVRHEDAVTNTTAHGSYQMCECCVDDLMLYLDSCIYSLILVNVYFERLNGKFCYIFGKEQVLVREHLLYCSLFRQCAQSVPFHNTWDSLYVLLKHTHTHTCAHTLTQTCARTHYQCCFVSVGQITHSPSHVLVLCCVVFVCICWCVE